MDELNQQPSIFDILRKKANLKQEVYDISLNAFKDFKNVIKTLVDEFNKTRNHDEKFIPFEFTDISEFEVELKFAGDVLIFMMHTNIFEFSRDHEVMRTPYIRDDKLRSYCGVINIYNFLSDSFKYNRVNDLGYLIGRIFINREKHYFIEGKREIGNLFFNFATSILDNESIRKIVESAMLYTINFDLLTPPYDSVKEVSVYEMQTTLDNMKMKTGKRLGFRFQADQEEFK